MQRGSTPPQSVFDGAEQAIDHVMKWILITRQAEPSTKQTKVTANAFTLAQNAISKAMASAKKALTPEVAFA